MGILRRKPDHSVLVVTNILTDVTRHWEVRPSSKTYDLTRQFYGRNPAFFCYRVNVKLKNSPARSPSVG